MKLTNFVFEGGGVKGIAYAGALKALKQLGHLDNVQKVGGTSAGAITAVLLALKIPVDELTNLIRNINFNDFADDSFGIVRDAKRFIDDYGFHKGENFLNWMFDQIRHKTGNSHTTFQQLKDNGYPDLYLTATNLSLQQVQVFNYKTTPDLPIALAARMSMGIPLYYKAFRYQTNYIMVDGGISMNYPIRMFDSAVPNEKTLGLRLDTKSEIEYNQNKWKTPPKEIENIIDYITALLDFMMEVANKKHLNKGDKKRTVFIDTLDVKTTDFNLNEQQIDALMNSGYNAVYNYFGRNDPG